MATAVIGYVDCAKWERVGNRIYRVALDKSYKEHLLSGLPIESIFAIEDINTRQTAGCKRCRRVFDSIEQRLVHECNMIVTCEDCGMEYQDDPFEDIHTCRDVDVPEISDSYSDYEEDFSVECRARKGKKKTSSRHVPKFEAKISKRKQRCIGYVQKIDNSSTLPVAARNEQNAYNKWEKCVNDILGSIEYDLVCGENCYSRADIDAIVARVRQLFTVDQTYDQMVNEWNKKKKAILADYKSLIVPFRYFNQLFHEEWDDAYNDRDFRINIYM